MLPLTFGSSIPMEQLKKFDPELEYVRRWLPEYGTPEYLGPMVDHKFARNRALETYKEGFRNYLPEA